MNRPKWMIFIGVLAIIFGVWGVVNQLVTIGSSSFYLAMEPEMEAESQGRGEHAPAAGSTSPIIEEIHNGETIQEREIAQADEDVGDLRHTYIKQVFALGIISLLISGAYVLSGVFLMTKTYGIRTFYYAMAVSILWSVVQTIVVSQAQLHMFLFFIVMRMPSMLIDLILATIVFIGFRYQGPGPTVTTNRKLFADAASIFLKPMDVGVPVISGALAALCALVIPFWIIGIPGVENDFARGWKIGLDVIMYYPITWVIVFGVSWGLRRVIPLNGQRSLTVVVAFCFMIFFAVALLRLGQAFQIMTM